MNKDKLRILAIGAHPDDNETRFGGTAVKFRKQGHTVKFISATNGETGHQEKGGLQVARIRAEETKKAGELIGVESEVLDIPTNRIEANIQTRERFITLIREFKPDLIFTHRLNDYHPDHRKTSELIQDSSYAIKVPGVCPLTTPLRYTPAILFYEDKFTKPAEFEPDVVVNIDDVMDKKMDMLHCHTSQMYEWLPWVDGELDQVPDGEQERKNWLTQKRKERFAKTADRFREQLKDRYGTEEGSNIECAEAFEVSEYGRELTEEEINEYFAF